MGKENQLSSEQAAEILEILKQRFHKFPHRHSDLKWEEIEAKLSANKQKLWSLSEMERTGGEPDVIGYDEQANEYLFVDCAPETPKGRRSICYDRQALEARKQHKPENSAVDVANEIGITILNEEQYRSLQQFGPFDQKTSSWLDTPQNIRQLGGAIFGDYRYGQVFIYHNGADSYYGARGFRGLLRV